MEYHNGDVCAPMELFNGFAKEGKSLLDAVDVYFKRLLVPLVPLWLETNHLTLMTLLWSVLILLFSFFAASDLDWLWAVSMCIFLQYITDVLDGEIGRQRKTGLIRWGYYMDHFLDYVFLCSILIGYSFLAQTTYWLFFILAIFGGFMVNSFLRFSALNRFKVVYMGIGPTEIRLLFIIINTLLAVFGKTYLADTLPLVLLGSLAGLFIVVNDTQQQIWEKDMREKRKNDDSSHSPHA